MKKLLTTLALFMFLVNIISAQTDEDALRYSQTTFGGTARGIGVAGAFGALGTDFTSLSINPAGIALYRTNEFMFTPGLAFINSNSDFAKSSNEAKKYNFNVSNFGFVWNFPYDEKKVKGWKNISFGFGANRSANFHNDIYYRGFNPSNSLITSYVNKMNAQGSLSESSIESYYPFDAYLAYKNNLIQLDANGKYSTALFNGGLEQSKSITTRGSITDYLISLGANYSDKVFIGATLSIPGLRYRLESTYTEKDINDSITDFNSFSLTDNLTTTGVGINAKLGIIYKVNDFFRFGAAIHSPTYFSMSDKYDSKISSEFNSGPEERVSPSGIFNYGLTTPWKVIGSAAVIIKKYGFISLDYEFLDYSESFFNFNNNSTTEDKEYASQQNSLINTKYTAASNLKIGGELVLDIFRIRAGYAMYGSPFNAEVAESGFDNSSNHITGGFGFREDNYFIDFGIVHSIIKTYNQTYTIANSNLVPGAKITSSANQFLITVGFKF
jgi:hypothetical protein